MAQYICTCKADAPSSNMLSKLQDAVDQMASDLNSYSEVSTDFGTYHSDISVPENTSEFSTASEWLEYVGEQVEHRALDGDSWIIVDSIADYGYGLGNHNYTWTENSETKSIKTARVLDIREDNPTGDAETTFKCLAIQEVGHGFNVRHKHGQYTYTQDDLVGSNVSPMATAYAYTNDDAEDTMFAGTATPPDHFEDEDGNETFDNYFVNEWYGGVGTEDRHWPSISAPAMEVTDRNTPL